MRKILSLVAAACISAVMLNPAVAQADPVVYEDSGLTWSAGTVVNDATASGGTARELKTAANGVVTVPDSRQVKVRAKGNDCVGYANMKVTVGNTVVGNQIVSANWTDYNFAVPQGVTGQLKVEFTTPFTNWFFFYITCERTLYVDKVTASNDGFVLPPPPPPTEDPTAEYVAMGDSYSSGWGADRTPAGVDPSVTVDNCGRTSTGAQVLLAAERNWELFNVACGGANTQQNMTTGSIAGEGPQIQDINSDTDVVTMTIGGNDTGLLWILDQCVLNTSFLCWGGITGSSIQSQFNDKLVALGPKLDAILQDIVVRSAGGVKIRVAGYPYIVAPTGDSVGVCTWMATDEQAAFTDMHVRTNEAIRASVARVASATGANVVYVDPLAASSPFMQRTSGQLGTSCAPQNAQYRYMNNVTEVALANGGWHPNILGQQYYRTIYAGSLPS